MTACVACGQTVLEPVLDLGTTPLANALLEKDALSRAEPRFPLRVARCPNCSLVQITDRVPPEQLFSDYVYFSSYSDWMLAHAKALTAELHAKRDLGSESLAIEIASNDGYLLQFYKQKGVPVLGIEPAANIAKVAQNERGIPTRCEFFGEGLGQRLAAEGLHADVIHAHNVFAHVPDPAGFLAGIRHALKPDGLAVIEFPYLRDFLEHVEFDTIYHEHVSYFSLTAVERMARSRGLEIIDARRTRIHGGSLQVYLALPGQKASPSVSALLAEEQGWGVDSRATYDDFSRKVHTLKDELLTLLRDLKSQGKRIAAYGASAKGATLLNFCGIGGDYLDFVADRSPHKVGKFSPGTHLPILSADALMERRPDYALLLSWNFADEILAQQKPYRDKGGKFIIPIPEPHIVQG
jgi:SAM-dependent methyltransferase